MKVKVRFFGYLIEVLTMDSITVELDPEAKIKDLINKLVETIGLPMNDLVRSLEVFERDHVILLNGRNICTIKKTESSLNNEDIVTFLPPVAGG
jgi:MoaD family protein